MFDFKKEFKAQYHCYTGEGIFVIAVNFNEDKKVTTVKLSNGNVGQSKCSEGDVYDKKIGFALALTNALVGSKSGVQHIIEDFDGTTKKKQEEKAYQKKLEEARKLKEYKKKQEDAKARLQKKKDKFEKDLDEYIKNYNKAHSANKEEK